MFLFLSAIEHNAGIDSVSILIIILIFFLFVLTWGFNRISILRIRRKSEQAKDLSVIMKHTLNMSNNYVLKLSIQDHYAVNMHGNFLPDTGMGYEESLNYIHPNDRHFYIDFCKKLVIGGKAAQCLFRWNVNRGKGQEEWRYYRDLGVAEYANPKLKTPTNIFCVLTDMTEQIKQDQRNIELTNRYRNIYEQPIVGLAFYDKNGYLLNVNEKTREILKFQSEHDPYYFDNTLFDIPLFHELINKKKVEDLFFCAKSVILERGVNCYIETCVHPILDEEGELLYITVSIRDLTQERNLFIKNRENETYIRQQNEEIQQYENELQYLMNECDMRFWRADFNKNEIAFYKKLSTPEKVMTFKELESFFIDDSMIVKGLYQPELYFDKPIAHLCWTRSIFHNCEELQWNMLDSLPHYDENGKLVECYGVIRNMTPLMKKQELLKKETERAKQSGMMKSTFMANMTHEIRTPLNSIVGFSDLLPILQTKEEKQEIIRVIMNNCDMLMRLINDLLALSTEDAGGIALISEDIDFSKTFDDIFTMMAERIQNPQVAFIKDNPYNTFPAHLDPGRIQQVITNFVTNAVKYTQEGHIKVGYTKQGNGIRIYCEDTGAGIPKEAQEKVFERFVKLNDYVQGTGLGLSICKAISEKCGGKIGVESEGEGKGSTFWMWIPTIIKAIILLFVLNLSPLAAQAQNDSTTVFSVERPLIYEDAWDLWPYTFLNENGEPDGYNIDLLKMMFKRLDIPYIIKLKPSVDAFNDLKEGRSDLIFGMEASFHHEIGSYGKSVIHLFTHSVVHEKNKASTIKSFQDLSHHKVIVHTGSFSHHLMQDKGWGDNAEGFEDMKEAIQKASSDPSNEIVWNTMSLKWLIHKYQIKNLELSPIDIPHGEYKFISKNQRLLNQLDSIYTVLLSEEKLLTIQNKWFYPEHIETGIPSWVWQLAAVIAVFSLFFLFYYLFYRIKEQKLTKDVRKKNDRLSLILKTSNVRFWIYNIPSKTFTLLDENGIPTRNLSLHEVAQQYVKEDFEHMVEVINHIVRGEKENDTINLRTKKEKNDEAREYTMALSVLRYHKNGRPSVIIGTRSDITEENKMRLVTQDNMLRYQAIFSSVLVDMAYYDKEGNLRNLNEKGCRTYKMTLETLLARNINIRDVLGMPDLDVENMEYTYLTQLFKAGKEEKRVLSSFINGEKVYYELQIVPVRDENGHLMGIYSSGRDVTEVANSYMQRQQNLQQQIKANEEVTNYINNINYVLKVGGVRMMNYYPDTHHLAIYSEIGHVEYEITQQRAFTLTHESDLQTVRRILISMDNHSVTPIEATIHTNLRIKGGYQLCLQMHMVPIIDDDGMAKYYFGMCRDVSEIMHTQKELIKETAKAQEVEVVKNAFLRNMSYEIRTPLNAVVGFAELFQMDHSSDDEGIFIEEIKENSRELLKLINNILFLSRLDAKMIEIKPRLTDFAHTFDLVCHTSLETNQKPGVQYIVDNPYEQLVVEIDARNVSVILEQIILNACQHTSQGSVHARIDYIGDRLIIAVEDTGEGIDEALQPTIFERFATGANSGSGLGLSICYELIQQMGGTINSKSKPGKGTTIWFSIPCKATEMVRKRSKT
jgi:PAS domain S-box-containing protein